MRSLVGPPVMLLRGALLFVPVHLAGTGVTGCSLMGDGRSGLRNGGHLSTDARADVDRGFLWHPRSMDQRVTGALGGTKVLSVGDLHSHRGDDRACITLEFVAGAWECF